VNLVDFPLRFLTMFITQTPIPVKPDWGKPGKKKARIAAGGDDTLFMSSATSIADEYGAT